MADSLRLIGERWRVVVSVLVVCISMAWGVTALTAPTYEATAQMFVAVRADQSVGELAQGGSFSALRVKSYPEIARSPLVLDPVIDRLNLSTTSEDLAGQVSADVPPDTVLVNVTVSAAEGVEASALANAVVEQLATVVEGLETTDPQSVSNVRATVVKPASAPSQPVSPRVLLNLAYGALAGLLLGIAAAALRASLDSTYKSAADVQAVAELSPLGVVPFSRAAAKTPLAADARNYSVMAESYRKIRTNLQFIDVDQPPRSIVVTSAVPREGKSLTSINLAMTIAQRGDRVCLIDADLRRPSIHTSLDLDQQVGLTTILLGRVTPADAVQRHHGVDVITSGPLPPNPAELLGARSMRDLVERLAETYDFVLLDAPPLLPVTDAAILATQTDGAVVVIRSGRTRREQVRIAISSLRSVEAHVLGAVLNMARVRGRRAARGYAYYDETDRR